MMSFIEYLFEKYLSKKAREETHPDGTYVCVELAPKFRDALYSWSKDHGIPNLADPNQYHCTIAYSRKGIPTVKDKDFDLPINAEIDGWKVFPTQNGGKCLVASLKSKELTAHFNDIMDNHGATYDYDEYKPHVTVSYDYGKDVPPLKFPNLKVTFNKVKIEPLDPDITPKKAK